MNKTEYREWQKQIASTGVENAALHALEGYSHIRKGWAVSIYNLKNSRRIVNRGIIADICFHTDGAYVLKVDDINFSSEDYLFWVVN